MRASFYEGARRFRTGTAPEPSAGAGEALLHVKRVGICGTDLHIFQGDLDHRVPKGGIIGLVSRHRGARVAISEVNPFRIELLRGLGLEVVGPGTDVVKFANDWTGGEGVDVAFEVTGNAAAVRLMTDVVRVWGTVSVVAIHSEPMMVNLYPMFARELTMHGSRLYTRAGWEEAIRLAASGAVPVGPLVSRKIPLEALQEGMEQALAGGPVMKVLIDLTA